MLRQTLKGFLLVALIGALPVFADIAPIDGWDQTFELSGLKFNGIFISMVTKGVSFRPTGMSAYSEAGWTQTSFSAPWRTATAGGPTISTAGVLTFDISFSPKGPVGPGSKNFTFDINPLFNGKDIFSKPIVASWATSGPTAGWTISSPTFGPPVPEESTVLLVTGWLVGIAFLIIRSKVFRAQAA